MEDKELLLMEKKAGSDEAIAPDDRLTVISFVTQCMKEAEQSKSYRKILDEQNWDAYHGRTTYNNKVEGQSDEFIPKVSLALEQIAASIKRGLVSFGNYFDVTLTPDPVVTGAPLTASGIVKLMRHRLEDSSELIKGCTDFATTLEDGIKAAALSSLLILKVHGVWDVSRKYTAEVQPIYTDETDETTGFTYQKFSHQQEDLVLIETKVWRLVVELVNPKDFFIDPSGRELYHIHRTYKDLYEIVDAADSGDYDKEAVKELARSSYTNMEQQSELQRQTNQPNSPSPDFRKEVELWEFWGTTLDSDGGVANRNCRCVIANKMHIIKKPEDNPNAHGEHPFVYSPLVRVPFTTLHKGLFDQAVAFNLLLNDIFNLAADGALGSSWGINLVQAGAIQNLDQFEDCIPSGSTLMVDPSADITKVFMNVKTGGVSSDTFNMMNYTDQQFNAASHLSDTKLGVLPKKTQSATGIADAGAATDNYIGAIIFNLEQNVIKPALRKAWLTMLQNVDNWYADDVVGCIGETAAKMLAQMSPARRFANYALGTNFKVDGLSSLMARNQEFQKLMLLQQELTTNPMFAQEFMKKYSIAKLIARFFKVTNMDPEDFQLTDEEKKEVDKTMADTATMAQVLGPQGNQQPGMPQPGLNQQPGNAASPIQGVMTNQGVVSNG